MEHLRTYPRLETDRLIWAIVILTAIPEFLLTGADLGFWGNNFWRPVAFGYGAFWSGLLGDWTPTYAAQPLLMWVTYMALHGSAMHYLGNMLALLAFSPPIIMRMGRWRFLGFYLLCGIGGALGFALLNAYANPMVGASGALFGLIGAQIASEATERRQQKRSMVPILRQLLLVIAINAVMWLWLDGFLAWETHLGGFLAGAALMLAFERKQRKKRTP